jgi:hypothetical protein
MNRGAPKEGGPPGCTPLPPNSPKIKFKKHGFCRHYGIKILRDFPFTQHQPLKSADDTYIRILKNKSTKLKKNKKVGDCIMSGTCS